MDPIALVRLAPLMERGSGSLDFKIGLIDGPVVTGHPDFPGGRLLPISQSHGSTCSQPDSQACRHGTFIAGMLSARRNSSAPGICPECTLLIRPVFGEGTNQIPSATPRELAMAIIDCIDAGARVINLSLAIIQRSTDGERALDQALNHAVKRGVLIVAAAGNQGIVGSSVLTSHAWVIPVVACDSQGRPLEESNVSSSIGTGGLTAPGDSISSLGVDGELLTLRGSSVAVPFVTGAISLLWSESRSATAAQIRLAITLQGTLRRRSLVPPLLDAVAAYEKLSTGR